MANVEDIFFKASQLEGNDRQSYLDGACGDEEVRNRVSVLLAAHDQASSFLEAPPIPIDDLDTRKRWLDETIAPLADLLSPSGDPTEFGQLGNYQLISIIGHGGMGVVFKAQDTKLSRTVAIKLLPPSLCRDEKYRKRFLREARATAQLSDPNIVTVHAVEDSSVPYIVMELVPGETLNDRLNRNGRLDESEIINLSLQIAKGLAAAHKKNLIHRDIKPSNILIDPDGNAKIVDFGLARTASDDDLSRAGEIFGTPRFMSPEQAGGEAVDHRTDLFSLGSVMYMMCTGQVPFSDNSMPGVMRQVRERELDSVNSVNPSISPGLSGLIQQLMAKSPDERVPSASDLSAQLDRLAQPPKINLPPKHVDYDRRLTLRTVVAVGVGLLLLLAVSEAAGWTRLGTMLADVIRVETPNGTLVVTVDDPDVKVSVDGKILSVTTGKNEFRYNIGKYTVQASKDGEVLLNKVISIRRDGREIVTIDREVPAVDRTARNTPVTGRTPNEESNSNRTSPIVGEPATLKAHDHFVLSVRYSPDGSKLASVQFGGGVKVWELSNNQVIFEGRADEQYPRRVFFSPDGQQIACGSRLWNISTGELAVETSGTIVAISGDGKRFANRFENNEIAIHEQPSKKELIRFDTNQLTIHEADFSPDGKLLATCSDEDLKLWDTESGQRVAIFGHDARRVVCVAFSPDGTKLASGGDDQRLRIWDLSDVTTDQDHLLFSLSGHDDSVSDVEFMPDGKHVVSVSRESAITFPKPGKKKGKTIKFWSLSTGREIWNQSGHLHNVTGVDIRSDGGQMVTCSYDKTIKIWSLENPLPDH